MDKHPQTNCFNSDYYHSHSHNKRARTCQEVHANNNVSMPSLGNPYPLTSASSTVTETFKTLDFSDLIALDEDKPCIPNLLSYVLTSEAFSATTTSETPAKQDYPARPARDILLITISDDEEDDLPPPPLLNFNQSSRNNNEATMREKTCTITSTNSENGEEPSCSKEAGDLKSDCLDGRQIGESENTSLSEEITEDGSARARGGEMSASDKSAAVETKILLTFEETECSFCTFPLKVGKGILVQDCLHPFCKPCLVTWIENAQTVNIKCPVDCGAMLLECEVKALVKPQVMEKLEKLSYEKIVRETPNAFKCRTVNCNGLCIFDDGSKVFLCPQCNKSNCIPCKAIHSGFSCEDYETEKTKCYRLNVANPEEVLRDLMEKKYQTNGFEQLIASGWLPTAREGHGGQDKSFYDTLVNSMAQQKIFETTKEFDCTICYCDVPAGLGVILQDCFHLFCKDCLISHIEHNDDPQVKCPHPGCTSILSPREVSALLPANVLEKVNKRSWSLAEAIIGSKFHCLTLDCGGFCELEGNVNAFQCPVCLKTNCIRCNAIHENVSCKDYKNRIVQNENDQLSNKAVDNLIATGMAMRCTKCTAPVQKDIGCDWIVCPMCRTELCWATKGPRWGPNGTGDVSGGCKCRVGGRLCHPQCRNCH